MFDATSRYAGVPDGQLTVTEPDGTTRTIPYKARRFPDPGAVATRVFAPIQGERPDQLAGRLLGDPQQFWRLCDANHSMVPDVSEDPNHRA